MKTYFFRDKENLDFFKKDYGRMPKLKLFCTQNKEILDQLHLNHEGLIAVACCNPDSPTLLHTYGKHIRDMDPDVFKKIETLWETFMKSDSTLSAYFTIKEVAENEIEGFLRGIPNVDDSYARLPQKRPEPQPLTLCAQTPFAQTGNSNSFFDSQRSSWSGAIAAEKNNQASAVISKKPKEDDLSNNHGRQSAENKHLRKISCTLL
jgi:hypothetical protein